MYLVYFLTINVLLMPWYTLGRYAVLFDIVKFLMILWHAFDVMTYIVILFLCVMTYFWRQGILFKVMTYHLTLQHMFSVDVMTYFYFHAPFSHLAESIITQIGQGRHSLKCLNWAKMNRYPGEPPTTGPLIVSNLQFKTRYPLYAGGGIW